ncbi:MAG: neutral zinc metallopeptidase [Candidatus Competibacterales bacterium]
MRWKDARRSTNVDDRRRGGSALTRVGGKRGLGLGATVIIVVVAMLLGFDLRQALQIVGVVEQAQETLTPSNVGRPAPRGSGGGKIPEDDPLGQFSAAVLGYTEDTWRILFQNMGRDYQEPTLVLFDGAVSSACGFAQAAVGPFYCPADGQVYIDLSFFRELEERFNAPGDFAQAYVIAHEVGHHVQNLLGISREVRAAQRGLSPAEVNQLSVRLELQADCLAGVWAHHTDRTQDILERGDVEEALGAASAIGDDRLQRQSQGYVVPESFTHGTSAQRMRWFRTGLERGSVAACDTFEAPQL